MSQRGGHLEWTEARILRDAPIINGASFERQATYSATLAAVGLGLPLLGAGSVLQDTPGHPDAPRAVVPQIVALEATASHLLDYRKLLLFPSQAVSGGLEIFFGEEHLDVYNLRGTTRTLWTLSRTLPYAVVSFDDFPVVVTIFDPAGVEADIVLTVVETSPAAGEVQISKTGASTTFVTDDLSSFIGRRLAFRYSPLGRYTMSGLVKPEDEPNNLSYSVTFSESIEARNYGATS